jgi:adenylate cyclase
MADAPTRVLPVLDGLPRNELVSIDPRYFLTGDVVERAPAERPKHDTIDAIMDWLAGPAQHIPSLVSEFDEYAWRMLAAGFPLLRATLYLRTLHPQYLGASFVWWRTTGRTVQTLVTHEVRDLFGDEDNPVRRVVVAGETVRRRIDVADDKLDFPILHDLKAEGATDYFALPVKNSFGTNYMVVYVTDRPGGFTTQEISDLSRVSQRLSLLADLRHQRRIATNILTAYLGPKTGPKVLAGHIRRGAGEEITAVLWSSDLRGFTERSDRLDGPRVIEMLNALFDAQAAAIARHGGEILKFIGDGLLAIFPIENASVAAAAACAALASSPR